MMYYEEKINSAGRIFWRSSPDGEFIEASASMYADRIESLRTQLEAANAKVVELERLCNWLPDDETTQTLKDQAEGNSLAAKTVYIAALERNLAELTAKMESTEPVALQEDAGKLKCQECGHVSTQYLTARSPFDDDQLVACAKCKSVGALVWACHFEGCHRESSNGMKNSKGEYVWSCYEHSPERTGE